MIEELDDPFEHYPELKKEREKLKRLADYEAGIRTRGGFRPKAGRPPATRKLVRFSILIDKIDEPFVCFELEKLKEKYGH